MKNKIFGLLFAGGILFLNGCVGRPEQNEAAVQSACEFPEYYEAVAEKVTFDTKLEVAEGVQPGNLKASRVELQIPDIEIIKSVFMDGWQKKKKKEEIEEPGYYHVLTEDFYSLSVSNGVRYNTPNAYYYQAALHYDDQDNLLEDYSRQETPDGMSEEKTLDMVNEALQKIGISAEGCFISRFTLPYTLMEEKEVWEDRKGNIADEYYKESWSRDDDAYYYVMNQAWQGLQVYHKYVFPDNNDMNAPIRVLWSRRGLEDLQVDYFFAFEAEDETLQLKDFSQIAATVADKYNAILNEADYIVTKATLYQAVYQGEKQNDYFTVPAWLLHITEKTDEEEYPITMLVDAVSGEELIS